jgi:EAL domain-containing protein (putative c-di-GMP-specific phosphodiesterase class I)
MIAEKVRSSKDANHLFYMGVTYGQGRHYGMPDLDPLTYADKFPTRRIRHKA